uniref:ornithine decarboxylase n=1 Tax=Chromera velia CCMP2878 TaxID=1169474 RepID=A0A0G4F124_9ALVE|eukprot:Cvel_14597.t1-p1 / transcript=Cvel_14597.t1 / gene=Cvel_14597 / organism=Chromera_velia_CCMP2878 / gene_product=Ornithine decarboxylase, putative / transcript_product=Ornithine decarboxylase, putative / location=Cvel_scaffold1044:1515-6359(-) / protein_length=1041 / sequence_SO=supercontig / SO=protein_coding / is_pseudo=false
MSYGPFEGVEKRVILRFNDSAFSSGHRGGRYGDAPSSSHPQEGFRSLFDVSDGVWQSILSHTACSILSKTSTHARAASVHPQKQGQLRKKTMPEAGCVAYLLSESSLFVYDKKLILKTCGTTTPLLSVLPILELVVPAHLQEKTFDITGDSASLFKRARGLARFLDFFLFSHLSYRFPEQQRFPHRSFAEETDFCRRFFPKGTKRGAKTFEGEAQPFQLPTSEEREFDLFVAASRKFMQIHREGVTPSGLVGDSERERERDLQITELLMLGIDENSPEYFAGKKPAELQTTAAAPDSSALAQGTSSDFPEKSAACDPESFQMPPPQPRRENSAGVLRDLLPPVGARTDQYWFDPCGYSANAVCQKAFLTVHVSPEEESSYASVETSFPFKHVSYPVFCDKVVGCFRPKEVHVVQLRFGQEPFHPEPLPLASPGSVSDDSERESTGSGASGLGSEEDGDGFPLPMAASTPCSLSRKSSSCVGDDGEGVEGLRDLHGEDGDEWRSFEVVRRVDVSLGWFSVSHTQLARTDFVLSKQEEEEEEEEERREVICKGEESANANETSVEAPAPVAVSVPVFCASSSNEETLSALRAAEKDFVLQRVKEDGGIREKGLMMVVDLQKVRAQLSRWRRLLPRVSPFYAIKSNPDPQIIKTLAQEGCRFDCASQAEIEHVLENVRPSDPGHTIIYSNTCKHEGMIAFAKSVGVKRTVFDSEDELFKIARSHPEAQLLLRINADDSSALCKMKNKFGAEPAAWPRLLQTCRSLGLNLVGAHFHVGSRCTEPGAFRSALEIVRSLFDLAESHGFPPLTCVDIGGGFPGLSELEEEEDEMRTRAEEDDAEKEALDAHVRFSGMASQINAGLEEFFPDPSVKIIAEPGRFLCAASGSLATKVIGMRPPVPSVSADEEAVPRRYFLTDGLYGCFNSILYDAAVPAPEVLILSSSSNADEERRVSEGGGASEVSASSAATEAAEKEKEPAVLFGPTCDGFDIVMEKAHLPVLQVGDWLLFRNMGAYTSAAFSTFNGFTPPRVEYVELLPSARGHAEE